MDQSNSSNQLRADFKPAHGYSYASANGGDRSSRQSITTRSVQRRLRQGARLGEERRRRDSIGAVRVNGVADQNTFARRNLFVIGVGCVAASGMIFVANMAESLGFSPASLPSRQATISTNPFESSFSSHPMLPRTISPPSFRFDDAEHVLSASSYTDNRGLVRTSYAKPDLASGFAPKAFADIPVVETKPLFEVDPSLQQAMLDAEKNLPPLKTTVPQQTLEVLAEPSSVQDDFHKIIEIEAGDTFSKIMNDNGVSRSDLPALEDHELVQRYLTKLKIGQKIDFKFGWQGDFKSLNVKVNRDTRVLLAKEADGYSLEKVHLPVEYERVVTSGTIDQSLYTAAEKANLNQSTIMTLAEIFQWELDFANDIRKGDHFSLVYDRLYRDSKYIGDGEILAAEFVRGDRVHRAIRFSNDEGKTAYYSPDGKAKGRSFMRHPVEIVRITSRFDPNRMHPVLHQIRAHKGVDYGSPHGSPIMAVADGHISYSGNRSAYGKTVIIKHDSKRTTLYAHMSRIDPAAGKVGKKVKRGDVIGYVGKTGRVTGTHLHYELRINGVHVDPLKVELPSPPPLAAKDLPKLKAVANELIAQMRSVTEMVSQASADDTEALLNYR